MKKIRIIKLIGYLFAILFFLSAIQVSSQADSGPLDVKGTMTISGQRATITCSALGNSGGTGEVTGFMVNVERNNVLHHTENWENVYISNGRYTCTNTIDLPWASGQFIVQIWAYGENGIPSGTNFFDVGEIEQKSNTFDTNEDSKTNDTPGFTLIILIAASMIVLIWKYRINISN